MQRPRRPTKSSSIPRRRKNMKRNYSQKKNDEEEDDDSVWMDVSTFKQFLRKEMDLRLWILGPDWKDQIRSESQWRLNLYKQWKSAIDDGIGKDFTEEYARYPPEFNQNNNNRPKRRKTSSRPKRKYYYNDDDYSQPKRQSRSINQRSSFSNDFDQDEYNDKELSSRRGTNYDGGETNNNAVYQQQSNANESKRRSRRTTRPSRDNFD